MRFMVSTPAQSSIKSSPNSEILRQRSSAPKSRKKRTLGFVSDGCSLVFHLFGELLKNRLIERNTASEALRDKIAECSFVLYKRVGEKVLLLQSPPSSRVWTSVFARQSASFALAMCCLTLPIPPFILIGCGCPARLPPSR